MISFNIDMKITGPDADEMFKALEDSINEGLDDFAKEIESVWIQKANSQLKSSKDKYLKGLQVEKNSEGCTVTLNGWLPAAIEEGIPRYDMKPGFLKNNPLGVIIPIGADRENGKQPEAFRRVTQNSPGDKWWHPGIQARAIHKQVEAEIEEISNKVFAPLIARIKL